MRLLIRPRNIQEAERFQEILRKKVRISPLKTPKLIAGVDAAYTDDKVIGAACLYAFPDLTLIQEASAVAVITFPYVSGFLSFREGPAIVKAVQRLRRKPDLIFVDGQGIAHPKGIGIASHIGVLLGTSTVGCAKSLLLGEYRKPGSRKGDWSPLLLD
ncbi:MAG: endonuclease V, partial [Nitrospirota bacterium]